MNCNILKTKRNVPLSQFLSFINRVKANRGLFKGDLGYRIKGRHIVALHFTYEKWQFCCS